MTSGRLKIIQIVVENVLSGIGEYGIIKGWVMLRLFF